MIRAIPAGYATFMELPLRVTADVNDVRLPNSTKLYHYFAVVLRCTRARSRPFTQLRLAAMPRDGRTILSGHAPVYSVPLDGIWCFFRVGVMKASVDVLWSYFHTHPVYVAEMMLYAGVNASQLSLDAEPPRGLGRQGDCLQRLTPALTESIRERLRAYNTLMVCYYSRLRSATENIAATTEPDGLFFRKTTGCIPFSIAIGAQVTALVFVTPSTSSVAGHSNQAAPLHTFFRLFASTASTLPVMPFAWL